jgi:hypothetical protein
VSCTCEHRKLSHKYLTNQHRADVGSGNFGPCGALAPTPADPHHKCDCERFEEEK